MATTTRCSRPTSGSALAQLTPLGFGPGIQSWYDEWIKPDPTQQLNGVPTRLVFGLEELFENRLPVPQNGQSDFKAIGPYNANGGACLLVLATAACSQAQQADPNNTTTHPDQHGGIFIPDGKGGVTLVAGNDGGNYTQHVGLGRGLHPAGVRARAPRTASTRCSPTGSPRPEDGIVYAGLQDNGEMRIAPTGRQVEVFGGDGVFTVVDPESQQHRLRGAAGGRHQRYHRRRQDLDRHRPARRQRLVLRADRDGPDATRSTSSPGGRQIVETTEGPATTSPGTPTTQPTGRRLRPRAEQARGRQTRCRRSACAAAKSTPATAAAATRSATT